MNENTKGRYRMFMTAYRKIGNFRAACEVAGIDRATVQERMRSDPAFAKRVAAARAKVVEKLADKQIVAATTKDKHGKYDTKAGQFMLTNLDPENYKHRREDVTFDGGAYESGISKARAALTPEERKELQAIGKRRILQRGTASEE
jgi:hypothetical protein